MKNYRVYDRNCHHKGEYAKIFEEEYNNLIKNPDYQELNQYLNFDTPITKIHDGYFAKDSKGNYKNSKKGETNDDESAYNLIMKEKEKLLSLDNKLRFIFSHSALKEGWDNPNVFQICTLNETRSNDKKRQEIGRGMRLCVNNNGERETDKKINRLTVMANESYDAFVSALQSDMEEELGIKFGIIEEKMFKDIVFVPKNITDEKRVKKYKKDGSQAIFNDLKLNNYITQQGYPTEKLKDAIENNYLEVNEKFENIKEDIIYKIEDRISMPNIVNSGDRKEVKILNDNFYKFINLWNIIKQKNELCD